MIWNYVETEGLVNLHVVIRNLVALVITSGETTWGYQKLHVSRKLEHGPRHYTHVLTQLQTADLILVLSTQSH